MVSGKDARSQYPGWEVAPIQAMIDSHKTINEIKSFIEKS
jgi:hypothetical protein